MKKDKPRLLSKLQVHEISGVDRGANAGARIEFYKRDDNNQGDNNMDIEKLAERLDVLEKSDKEKSEKIEKLQVEKQELETFAKMSDVEKGYMDKMTDEEKKKFMAMDADKRKKEMAKADEIKKAKAKAEAETVSKAELESIQKANEALEAKIEKMEKEKEFEVFKADVSKRVPSIASDEKADFAKGLYAMGEEQREAVIKELEGAEKVKTQYMSEMGVVTKSESDPEVQLDSLAKKLADEKNITKQAAYTEVIKSGKGAELYSQIGKN